MSLAARWPIVASEEVDLLVSSRVDPQDWLGTLLAVVVQAPEPVGPLIYASPKPSYQRRFEYEREQQAVRAARTLEAMAARYRAHVSWPVTSTPLLSRRACGSGAACIPSTGSASPTAMPGRSHSQASRDSPSIRPILWSKDTGATSRDDDWTTSSSVVMTTDRRLGSATPPAASRRPRRGLGKRPLRRDRRTQSTVTLPEDGASPNPQQRSRQSERRRS